MLDLSFKARMRRMLLHLTPHGCGDSWMIAQRLLGLFLLLLAAALGIAWLVSGCAIITVNGGPGSIESDKAAILVKPNQKKESEE